MITVQMPEPALVQTPGEPTAHAELEVLCDQLQSVLWGRAADTILEAGVPQGSARITTLSAWDWRLPAMDIGRKGVNRTTGEQLLMPVRLDWGGNDALIRVDPAGSEAYPLRWQARSMGWSDTGLAAAELDEGSLAHLYAISTHDQSSTIAALQRISQAGRDSMWRFLTGLEPFVTATVRKAHAAVRHEIAGTTGRIQDVLPETGLEQVVNTMLLGAEDEDASNSSAMRLLNLCLRPECFVKVDPLMYLRQHIRRDAEEQIRRAIGDPRIGPKIRRLASSMPGSSIEEMVEEYRLAFPKDRLSLNRAEAALSVRPDPMAGAAPLDIDGQRALA